MKLGIYGAGGFGLEVLQWFRNSREQEWYQPVFLDDTRKGEELGVPIMDPVEFAAQRDGRAVIAVGDPAVRERLAKHLKGLGIASGGVTHKSVVLSQQIHIGPGSILCPFALISPKASIGLHCHLNIYSYVAHNAALGDYVTLSPRAHVNGNCRVGSGAFLGTGAILREGIHVGAGAVIGAGAVVVKNVPAGETWVGIPARPITNQKG